MDEEVGKRQVADGVVVLMPVKVVAVVAECLSQAMAVIELSLIHIWFMTDNNISVARHSKEQGIDRSSLFSPIL